MKISNTTHLLIKSLIPHMLKTRTENKDRTPRTRFGWLASAATLITGLLSSHSAAAFDFLAFGEGTLPSGQIVSMYQVTFAPGESFPWHFHPGPLWGYIVIGTLTDDQGC